MYEHSVAQFLSITRQYLLDAMPTPCACLAGEIC